MSMVRKPILLTSGGLFLHKLITESSHIHNWFLLVEDFKVKQAGTSGKS